MKMTPTKWKDIWHRFDVIVDYQDGPNGNSNWDAQEKVLRTLLDQKYNMVLSKQGWKKFNIAFDDWYDRTDGNWDQQKVWIIKYLNKVLR